MWQVKHGHTSGPKSTKCIYTCTICNAQLGFHKGLSPLCHWRSKHPEMPPTSICVKLIATGEIHKIQQIYKHVLKCGLADCSHITTANKQSHDAKLQMARHWRDDHAKVMNQGNDVPEIQMLKNTNVLMLPRKSFEAKTRKIINFCIIIISCIRYNK